MSTEEDDSLVPNSIHHIESSGAISNVPSDLEEMSVQNILDEIGFTFIHAVFLFSLGVFAMLQFFGASTVVFVLPFLTCEWQLSGAEQGLVASFTLVGNGIGSVLIGPVSDKFGRKPSAIIVSLLSFLFTFMNAQFSHEIYLFTTFSVMTAICTGAALPISTTYWTEVSSTKWKKVGLGVLITFMSTGFICACSFAYFLLNSHGWEICYFYGSLIGFIPFLTLLLLPESPMYLNNINKQEQTRSSLKRISFTSKTNFDLELIGIEKDFGISGRQSIIESLKSICGSDHRRDTIRIASFLTCTKACLNGQIYLITKLLAVNYCNITLSDIINVTTEDVANTVTCSALTDEDYLISFSMSIVIYLSLLGAIVLSKLVGKVNTIKALAGISLVGYILPLICMPTSLTVTFMSVVYFCVYGITMILFVLLPQFFPNNVRTTGFGLAHGMSTVASALPLFLTVLALDSSIQAGLGVVIVLASSVNLQVWTPGFKVRVDEVENGNSQNTLPPTALRK